MNKIIKILIVVLLVNFISCSKDDNVYYDCNGDCNQFKGRVYTEDGVGIRDVEILVSFTASYGSGLNYTRNIAKSKTDSDGNYYMEGFVKDNEFNNGSFYLAIDDTKIENSISSNFLKPSELYEDGYSKNNVFLIPNLVNRSQIISTDYKVPYKTILVVNLNNFNPSSPNDTFGVGNGIKYGFETQNRFLTKQLNNQGFNFSTGINTTMYIPSVYGENHLRIYKFRNGLGEYLDEVIFIENPNTTPPLNYSY